MVKKIKSDLILKEDMSFDESIEVEGNIICENERKNLIVAGDIVARDIVARDIDAWDIDAWNIVFCENIKLKKKSEGKIKAKAVIRKRFELEQKEWKSD